jgi:hypothetical protein
MKPITIKTPVTLIALLGGGVVLTGIGTSLHRLLVPWALMIGVLLFVAGLLLALIDFFRAIAILRKPESRQRTGIILPILTALIAAAAWSIVVTVPVLFARGASQPCPFTEHFPEMPPDAQIVDSWCNSKIGMDHTCIYKVKMNDHGKISALLISNGFPRVTASEAYGISNIRYPTWWPPDGDFGITEIYLHRERDKESGFPYLNRIVRYDSKNDLYYFQWYDL